MSIQGKSAYRAMLAAPETVPYINITQYQLISLVGVLGMPHTPCRTVQPLISLLAPVADAIITVTCESTASIAAAYYISLSYISVQCLRS
jgi:hypothetical protein